MHFKAEGSASRIRTFSNETASMYIKRYVIGGQGLQHVLNVYLLENFTTGIKRHLLLI